MPHGCGFGSGIDRIPVLGHDGCVAVCCLVCLRLCRYWFRTIDLESDGFISRHDMDFFYKEQLHRMDCLAQEVVQFEDMLCQMTDMVKPACQGHISMLDLKR